MMAAFVLIKLAISGGWDEVRSIHQSLHTVAGVKTVHFVAGPTDAILFVEGADQSALGEALGKIRGVKGVASTDTRVVWPI